MTTDGMNKGDDKGESVSIYTGFVVLVLDVLGQKEAMRKLSSPDDRETTIHLLKESLGVREQVANAFGKFVESFDTTPPEELIAQLKSVDRQERYRSVRRFKTKRYGFSDTLIAYFPFVGQHHMLNSYDLMAMFTAVVGTMCYCNAAKIPVRGGIELGWGVDWQGSEIYGPALLKAYELGEHCADYPRVVMGSELTDYMNGLASSRPTNEADGFEKAIGQSVISLSGIDDDGRTIVDYLGEGARRLYQSSFLGTLFNGGLEFAHERHAHFNRAGNTKVAAKYARLLRYYENAAPRWQSTTSDAGE